MQYEQTLKLQSSMARPVTSIFSCPAVLRLSLCDLWCCLVQFVHTSQYGISKFSRRDFCVGCRSLHQKYRTEKVDIPYLESPYRTDGDETTPALVGRWNWQSTSELCTFGSFPSSRAQAPRMNYNSSQFRKWLKLHFKFVNFLTPGNFHWHLTQII